MVAKVKETPISSDRLNYRVRQNQLCIFDGPFFHFHLFPQGTVNTFSNYGYLLFYNVLCFKNLTYLIT